MRSLWHVQTKGSWSVKVANYGVGLVCLFFLLNATGFERVIALSLFVSWLCMTIRVKGNSLLDWFEAYRAIDILHTTNDCSYGSCCGLDHGLQHIAGERQRAINTLERSSSTMSLARGHLGLCCLFGDGVERDINKGWELCLSAARDLNYEGIYGIGYCYEHGITVAKNELKALAIYQMASKQTKNNRVKMITKSMGTLTVLLSMILVVSLGYFLIGWFSG